MVKKEPMEETAIPVRAAATVGRDSPVVKKAVLYFVIDALFPRAVAEAFPFVAEPAGHEAGPAMGPLAGQTD